MGVKLLSEPGGTAWQTDLQRCTRTKRVQKPSWGWSSQMYISLTKKSSNAGMTQIGGKDPRNLLQASFRKSDIRREVMNKFIQLQKILGYCPISYKIIYIYYRYNSIWSYLIYHFGPDFRCIIPQGCGENQPSKHPCFVIMKYHAISIISNFSKFSKTQELRKIFYNYY